MFKEFNKNDKVLNKKPFIDYQVQFNIFNKIIEEDKLIALKDGNKAIAMCNKGYSMWLFINEKLPKNKIENIIEDLCSKLEGKNIVGVIGSPNIVRSFAKKYSAVNNLSYKTVMGMESYECVRLLNINKSKGSIIKAEKRHLYKVAEYLVGFILYGFNQIVSVESQLSQAEKLIISDNLFLWVIGDDVKSMANIAHRSSRYARINSVYTPPNERRNGYASSIVHELSQDILEEGLTPMLYADIQNPTSNKIYRNMGYISRGRIDEISFY